MSRLVPMVVAGVALEHALERLEELIEIVPVRQERGELDRRVHLLCADREERLHRLDEQGKAQVIGKWRVAGDVDQGERRDGLRHVLGLFHPRQIFVLAKQDHGGVGAGKAEPLRDDGGERRAGIIVGCDHARELEPPHLGENRLDLVERVGGKVLGAVGIADQILEAGAGIIVEDVVDAGRGDPRQLTIVAMGRADDEDDPIRRSGFAACVDGVLPVHTPHGRLVPKRGGRDYATAWIDRRSRLGYCP